MFVFGHIGIGRALLGRSRWKVPVAAFVLGALLPDLIDKSLYYSRLTPYAAGTRTFGHTGPFCCALVAIAMLSQSRAWSAVALGVATHLALDGLLDLISSNPSSEWIALTWPFLHTHFAPNFGSALDELGQIGNPAVLISEIIGALLIVREYRLYTRRAVLPQHPEPGPDRVGGIGAVPVVERDE